MKLTLEVSDQICKRISAAVEQRSPVSVKQFIEVSIESELRRVEGNRDLGKHSGDLAALAKQLDRLEKGQRAIVALVDSSAAVFSALLHGRSTRR